MTVKTKDLPASPAGLPKSAYPLQSTVPFPDPFLNAVTRANAPEGLLGKWPANSLDEVAKHLGLPTSEWGLTQWRSAAELLAHWVDELHIQAHSLRLLNAPKKRGRPTKVSPFPKGLFGIGLLTPLMQPKKGGRPQKWSDEKKIHAADTLDLIREKYCLRSYDAAINKLIELIAEQRGKSPRSTFTRPLKTIKSILRNVAQRGRRLRSKSPK